MTKREVAGVSLLSMPLAAIVVMMVATMGCWFGLVVLGAGTLMAVSIIVGMVLLDG